MGGIPKLQTALLCTLLACGGCDGLIGHSADDPRSGSPGDPGSGVPTASAVGSLFECDSPAPAPAKARLVRLSGEQYARAVDVLRRGRSSNSNRDRSASAVDSPFPDATTADRFTTISNSHFIGEAEATTVLQSASTVAADIADDLTSAGASCAANDFDESCARSIINEKAEDMLGRPLDADELQMYVDLATDSRVTALGDEAALETVLEALLSSPSFLFRTELGAPLGDGTFKLTPHEVAAALAYTLTDGPPDQQLWEAANDGSLADPAEIKAQVRRVLGSLDQNDAMARFIREYFHYDEASSVGKELAEFPFHDAEALEDDTRLFVEEVLARSDAESVLQTLLTANWGFARAGTAESYNLASESLPSDGSPELVTFESGERVGILSQPSWIVAYSKMDHNDAIRRGKFVREALLCGSIPPINIGMVEPLDLSPDKTMRESLEQHVSDPSCQGCHSLMDPLGLPFSGFDHLGRERDMEAGRPVDASGSLTGSGSQDGDFDGVPEMMDKLAASEIVRQCFVVHAYEYFRGAPRTESDGCALQDADAALLAAGGDVVEMIAEFFASDEFLIRVPMEEE